MRKVRTDRNNNGKALPRCAARIVSCGLLPLFCMVHIAGAATPQEAWKVEGVPIPKPSKEYCQPVTKPTIILQDNDGAFRQNDPFNRYGWDYKLALGSPVVATRSGVVTETSNRSNIGGIDASLFVNEANYVCIDHMDGTGSRYLLLLKNSDPPKPGEYVLQGEEIGRSGDTGLTQYPHLLYMAFDTDTGDSIPSRFADFYINNGVPRKNDKVPAATPPAVPLDVIKTYKKLWRAASLSARRGFNDIAWQFTTDLPRHEEYFYHKVLKVQQAAYKELIVKRLKEITGAQKPGAAMLLEAFRYQETFANIHDWDIKTPLRELTEAMMELDKEELAPMKKEKTAMRYWVKGLRMEFLDEREEALDLYVKAIKQSRGPLGPRVRERLDQLIRTGCADFGQRFTRLEHEKKKALAGHLLRIENDAKEMWPGYRAMLEARVKQFPEIEEEAKTELENAVKLFRNLASKK